MTTDHRDVLLGMYRAFNDRDIDRATEFLAPEVSWPNAETGGRVEGRSGVRAYWENQWQTFDPKVEPLQVSTDADGLVRVRVHELNRSLDGAILADRKIEHVFTFDGAFISGLTVIEADPDPDVDEDDDDDDGDGDGGDS